jgi:hypothetical protein
MAHPGRRSNRPLVESSLLVLSLVQHRPVFRKPWFQRFKQLLIKPLNGKKNCSTDVERTLCSKEGMRDTYA